MAIASSRSSSDPIWSSEFRFDVYDPAKNAAIPTTTIIPIINPLNVDFFTGYLSHYYFDLIQNHQNSFEFVLKLVYLFVLPNLCDE